MIRAAFGALVLLAAAPSQAVVKTYQVTASGFNFTKSFGPGNILPVPVASVQFLVDLDLGQSTPSSAINFRLLSTNLPGSESWSAFYRLEFNGFGSLYVGNVGTADCIFSNPGFCFLMGYTPDKEATFNLMIQQVQDTPSLSSYGTTLGRVSFQEVAAVVPEPESWALLIAGFGLVGAVMRQRRAQALA